MTIVKDILKTSTEALKAVVGDRALFEARLLVGHALQMRVEEIAAHDQEPVDDCVGRVIEDLVARRVKREPIAYLLGKKEFYGYTFEVNSNVLIPRPESEALIEVVLKWVSDFATRPGTSDVRPLRILDLGTGSGCLALTLAKILVDQCCYNDASLEIIAVDISESALAVFERNRRHLDLPATLVQSELGDILKGPEKSCAGKIFDLIVSNPPYIPTTDMPALADDIRLYEPHSALDGGDRGLLFYDAVIEKWLPLLRPGGLCVLETYSHEQRHEICKDFCSTDTRDLHVAEVGNLRVAEQGCLLVISLPVSR